MTRKLYAVFLNSLLRNSQGIIIAQANKEIWTNSVGRSWKSLVETTDALLEIPFSLSLYILLSLNKTFSLQFSVNLSNLVNLYLAGILKYILNLTVCFIEKLRGVEMLNYYKNFPIFVIK